MTRTILFDSGVLGLLTHPRSSPESDACLAWMRNLLTARDECIIPEVIDYEIRREYLRRNSIRGIQKLENLTALRRFW